MHPALLLVVSYLPGLLWVWFFHSRDRREPEPAQLVIRTFFLGSLMVFPAGLIESLFSRELFSPEAGLGVLLVSSVLVIGLVEEYAKYAAVRLTMYEDPEFNEVMDGIIYMVSAALGFAAAENMFYTLAFGLRIGVIRAFTTTLAHASFSGIVGFYLGLAKVEAPERGGLLIAWGLAIAIILHGLYDFLLLGGLVSPPVVAAMILAAFAFLLAKIRRADELSPF